MVPRLAAAALAALVAIGCAVQVIDLPPLSVVSVHEAPGRQKADICRAARDWAALNFRDSKAVVEVYDLEAGTLIGKGRITVAGHVGTPFPVDFTLRVECRDGRARSTFDGFLIDNTYPLREDSLNRLQSKAAARVDELGAGLGKAIAAGRADF